MPLTNRLSTCTVSGSYVDLTGTPIAGQVGFTSRAILTDSVNNQILINKRITATLDANGSFSVVLPVTDDPDLTPSGFTYLVEELFAGGRTFDMNIPSSATTLNLADVAPAATNAGLGSTYTTVAQYTTLDAQVQTLLPTINTVINTSNLINSAVTSAATAATAATTASAAADEYARNIHPFVLMGV